MGKPRKWKKLVSLLLVMAMVCSMDLPMTVRAEEAGLGEAMIQTVSDGEAVLPSAGDGDEASVPEDGEETPAVSGGEVISVSDGGVQSPVTDTEVKETTEETLADEEAGETPALGDEVLDLKDGGSNDEDTVLNLGEDEPYEMEGYTEKWYRFTASKEGVYVFSGGLDAASPSTYGYIYLYEDKEGDYFDSIYLSKDSENRAVRILQNGETVYLKVSATGWRNMQGTVGVSEAEVSVLTAGQPEPIPQAENYNEYHWYTFPVPADGTGMYRVDKDSYGSNVYVYDVERKDRCGYYNDKFGAYAGETLYIRAQASTYEDYAFTVNALPMKELVWSGSAASLEVEDASGNGEDTLVLFTVPESAFYRFNYGNSYMKMYTDLAEEYVKEDTGIEYQLEKDAVVYFLIQAGNTLTAETVDIDSLTLGETKSLAAADKDQWYSFTAPVNAADDVYVFALEADENASYTYIYMYESNNDKTALKSGSVSSDSALREIFVLKAGESRYFKINTQNQNSYTLTVQTAASGITALESGVKADVAAVRGDQWYSFTAPANAEDELYVVTFEADDTVTSSKNVEVYEEPEANGYLKHGYASQNVTWREVLQIPAGEIRYFKINTYGTAGFGLTVGAADSITTALTMNEKKSLPADKGTQWYSFTAPANAEDDSYLITFEADDSVSYSKSVSVYESLGDDRQIKSGYASKSSIWREVLQIPAGETRYFRVNTENTEGFSLTVQSPDAAATALVSDEKTAIPAQNGNQWYRFTAQEDKLYEVIFAADDEVTSGKTLYLYEGSMGASSYKSLYASALNPKTESVKLSADKTLYLKINNDGAAGFSVTVKPVEAAELVLGTKQDAGALSGDQWYIFTAAQKGFYELSLEVTGETTSYRYQYAYVYDSMTSDYATDSLYVSGNVVKTKVLELDEGESRYIKINTDSKEGRSLQIRALTSQVDADGENAYLITADDVKAAMTITPSYRGIDVAMSLSSKETGTELTNYYYAYVDYRKKGQTEWSGKSVTISLSNGNNYRNSALLSGLEMATEYELKVRFLKSSEAFAECGSGITATTLTTDKDVVLTVESSGTLVLVKASIVSEEIETTTLCYREQGSANWEYLQYYFESETKRILSGKPNTTYEFCVRDYSNEKTIYARDEAKTGDFAASVALSVKEEDLKKDAAVITVDFTNYTGMYADGTARLCAGVEYTTMSGDARQSDDSVNLTAGETSGAARISLSDLEADTQYTIPVKVWTYGSSLADGCYVDAGTVTFTTKKSALSDRLQFRVTPDESDGTRLHYSVSLGDLTGVEGLDYSYRYDIKYRLKGSQNWTTAAYYEFLSESDGYAATGTITGLFAGSEYEAVLEIDNKRYSVDGIRTKEGEIVPHVTLTPQLCGGVLAVNLTKGGDVSGGNAQIPDASAGEYEVRAYIDYSCYDEYMLATEDSASESQTLSAQNGYAGEWLAYRDSWYGIDSGKSYPFVVSVSKDGTEIYRECLTLQTEKLQLTAATETVSGSKEKILVSRGDVDASYNINYYHTYYLLYREKGSTDNNAWKYTSVSLYSEEEQGSTTITGLRPETTYELKVMSSSSYSEDEVEYASAEFTTPVGVNAGTFAEKVTFSGYHVLIEGKYTPSDYAEDTALYLVQYNAAGEVIDDEYSLYWNDGSYRISESCLLDKNTASVRIKAVEDRGVDSDKKPVSETLFTESYTREKTPDVQFAVTDRQTGASTLTVFLTYTGDLCLAKGESESFSTQFLYGTDADEATWKAASVDSVSFDEDSNVKDIQLTGLTDNTTYHAKLIVGMNRKYDYKNDTVTYLDKWELPLESFTTGENVTYDLEELFPDSLLRNYVIGEAGLTGADTQITTSQLEKVTKIYLSRNYLSDATVKSLKGIDALPNLYNLQVVRHEVTDTSDVDWSKLKRLTSVDLEGNDLTAVPDLSGCTKLTSLDLSMNKIAEADLKTLSEKLPAGLKASDCSLGSQRANGLTVTAEDVYYQRKGKSLLAVKLSGYKTGFWGTGYTFKYLVDGEEIELPQTYDNIRYNADTGLALGAHTLQVMMYGSDKTTPEKTVDDLSFTVVPGCAFMEKARNYSNVNDDSFSLRIFSDKKPTAVSLVKTGETAAVSKILSPNVNTTTDEYRYEKLGDFYVYSSSAEVQVYHGYINFVPLKYTGFEAGVYDVVLQYADDTTEKLSRAVEITGRSLITGAGVGSGYDSESGYFYLALSGSNIDPTKLDYTFRKDESSEPYTAEYVNAKKVSGGYIIKFKKSAEWTAAIQDTRWVNVTLTAKSGNDSVIENGTFDARISNGIYYFERNEVNGRLEIAVTSELAKGMSSYKLSRYNSWSDYYNGGTAETIAFEREEITETLSYLTPVKDGAAYTLPSGYYVIEAQSDFYNDSRSFEIDGIRNSSTKYWSGEELFLEGTKSASFGYTTAYKYSGEDDKEKFRAELLGEGITQAQTPTTTFASRSGYEHENYLYFGMTFDTSALAIGKYTINLYYSGNGAEEKLATKNFYIVDADKFIMLGSGIYSAYWINDNSFQFNMSTMNSAESDDYTVRLTDIDGNAVSGLTSEVVNRSSRNVRIKVSGLKKAEAYRSYYIYVEHKTFGEAYKVEIKTTGADLTKKYFNVLDGNEKGDYTSISGDGRGFTYRELDGRVDRIVAIGMHSNVTYPVTLKVYKPYETEEICSVEIAKSDLENAKANPGYYYFTKSMIRQLPDKDACYDITATGANGVTGNWTRRYLGTSDDSDEPDPDTEFTVTFNLQGKGTAIPSVKANAGSTISAPAAPEAEGFTFGGWFTTSGFTKEWDFKNDVVTGDITLFAKWIGKYTVTLKDEDGTVIGTPISVTEGQEFALTKPAPKEGYKFLGWSKDGIAELLEAGTKVEITKDTIFTAKWSELAYTITVKDGDNVLDTKEVKENGSYTLPEAPAAANENLEFAGFSGNNGRVYQAAEVVTGISADMTFTAKWHDKTKAQYTITYVYGYTGAEDSVLTCDEGETVSLALPVRKGYAFRGWKLDDTTTYPAESVVTVTENITLTAQWETEKVYVTVTVQNDGATVDYTEIEKGGEYTLPVSPVKAGYSFHGWKGSNNMIYKAGTKVSVNADMTFTAQWKQEGTGAGDDDESDVPPAIEDPTKYGLYVQLLGAEDEDGSGVACYTYTGEAITPRVKVWSYVEGKEDEGLIELTDADYTVKYANNKLVGGAKTPTVVVTGKGCYSGKEEIGFKIVPKSLTELDRPSVMRVAVGAKATPSLYYGSMKLGAKDYELMLTKDSESLDAKSYKVQDKDELTLTVKGIGNYKDSVEITVRAIDKKNLLKFSVDVNKSFKPVYNGEDTKELLTFNASESGKYQVSVLDKTSKNKLDDTEYYVVFSKDTVNTGTVKFTVIGKGDYTGCTVTKSYKIAPDKTSEMKLEFDKTDEEGVQGYRFDPAGTTVNNLRVSCSRGGESVTLKAGRDYKVSYAANKKVGTGKVNIAFIGNYKGNKLPKGTENTFSIRPASFAELAEAGRVKIALPDKTAKNLGLVKSAPIITVDGVTLKSSNYRVEYELDSATGESSDSCTVKVAISGVANLSETLPETFADRDGNSYELNYTVFKVDAATQGDLSKAKIKIDPNAVKSKAYYTGAEVVLPASAITVTCKVNKQDVVLEENQYTVTYMNNVNKGKATIVVQGTGETGTKNSYAFVGSKTATFSIGAQKISFQGR